MELARLLVPDEALLIIGRRREVELDAARLRGARDLRVEPAVRVELHSDIDEQRRGIVLHDDDMRVVAVSREQHLIEVRHRAARPKRDLPHAEPYSVAVIVERRPRDVEDAPPEIEVLALRIV